MFRELVELGKRLQGEGKLPPPGFYPYAEPIRWVVHFSPGEAELREASLDWARPYSGRTSGLEAHLLADEGAYALGVDPGPKGQEKHRLFLELLDKFLGWKGLRDPNLRQAVGELLLLLRSGRLQGHPLFPRVRPKDWVSFVPEWGPLAGQHFFQHPEAQAFWQEELAERSAPGAKGNKRAVLGECAVCGASPVRLVGKIPLGVRLAGTKPLHSFNASAFPSFQGGAEPEKQAPLGLCFPCGDTATRAFNYLVDHPLHRLDLVRERESRDSLANQTALFWLKAPGPLEVGGEAWGEEDLLRNLAQVLAGKGEGEAPPPALGQLEALLRLPWRPKEAGLTLEAYAFYLAVVSPNVGRVAVREWIATSLAQLQKHLASFLEGLRVVGPWGEPPRVPSLGEVLEALGSENPNLVRGLLRTAYLGQSPPKGLWQTALDRLRNPRLWNPDRGDWERRRSLWPLVAALKLGLFHGREEAKEMATLSADRNTPAYLCGRLLAVLEEAQLRASNFKINQTLVDRFYGAASLAPASTFGPLLRQATTAHFPEVGQEVSKLAEEILTRLAQAGGFPKVLSLPEQAEFALGFYAQRAAFRAGRGKGKAGSAATEGWAEGRGETTDQE